MSFDGIEAMEKVFILDQVFQALPTRPLTDADKEAAADRAYHHIWAQSAAGLFPASKAA